MRSVFHSDMSLGKNQFNQEPGVKTFRSIDYLEETIGTNSPVSNSDTFLCLERQTQSSGKSFVVMDYSTILPTRINVSARDAESLTVEWLLHEYIKRQTQKKNVRFDMGSVVCLKTRTSQIQYDYVLTQPEAKLSMFPDEMVLETYHSRPVAAVDFAAFDVLGLVGQGSFGSVLATRKKDTGKIYAMKVIAKSKFQKSQSEVYIFGEKNILMELDHPYVVDKRLPD